MVVKKWFYPNFNVKVRFLFHVYREFFELLLNNEEGWRVDSVDTNFRSEEVRIHINCDLHEFEYEGQSCSLYDHAPCREWSHLDRLQYRTYLVCSLPRVRTASGKVKTIAPPRADGTAIAADLLLKSDHTVNEISDMTGFSNARYFSTCFRKEYQQTPSKYRKLKNKANF